METTAAPEEPRPIVAIVGRPNVGKSTLFNRVLRRRHAIVHDRPGVTRDRLYAPAEWSGHRFVLADTGGLVPESPVPMDRLVNAQVEAAVASADVVLFLVDGRVPPTPMDEAVARRLREIGQPVFLVTNKVDGVEYTADALDYWQLGLGEPHPISAAHGLGVGDLLDQVVATLPATPRAGGVAPAGVPRVAIVGRPNVGKSSLLNRLAGQETAIVSEIPGTTRDAVDTMVELDGRPHLLIDTAGLRRRGRVAPGVEQFSALRTLAAIDRAEVVLLLLDAGSGITAQDVHVASMVASSRRAVVLVVNKWDLADRAPDFARQFEEEVRGRLHFLPAAPMVRVSALTGRRVARIPAAIAEVHRRYHRRIPTSELNEAVERMIRRNPPPAVRGKDVRVLYAAQVGVAPQRFVFFVNTRLPLPESYRRYLANRLRESFDFAGVPLDIRIRPRSAGGRRR